jgi:hypothetical protein
MPPDSETGVTRQPARRRVQRTVRQRGIILARRRKDAEDLRIMESIMVMGTALVEGAEDGKFKRDEADSYEK